MSGILILVVAAVVLVVVIVIVAVVAGSKRKDTGADATLDPPYGQRNVPDPTAGDPQVAHEVDESGVHYPDGPDNIRNPDVDNQAPGPSTPKNFPPPGPPRE